MRTYRTAFMACCLSTLALACGGGSGGSDDSTFKVYASAQAPVGGQVSLIALGGSPTSLRQTFYKGWVSTSEDCSDPVLLDDLGASGKKIQFFDDPVIFQGSPPDGEYSCVIVAVSDTMQFQPDAEAQTSFPGTCSVGTTYEVDTFKTGQPDRVVLGSEVPQVGEGTAAVAVPQVTHIFISTNLAALTGIGIPTSQQVQLLSPLVVPGETTFFADFSDVVTTNEGHCWLDKGAVGFR